MANTTSGTTTFGKTFAIDDIVTEAYERLGLQVVSGFHLTTARRSLDILFQEWGNRGLHYWEVGDTNVRLIEGQSEYVFYRAPADGTSSGVATTLDGAITSTTATSGITLTASTAMPSVGTLRIDSENITYTGISSLVLSGVTRGTNGTTAATHSDGATVTQLVEGLSDITSCTYRSNIGTTTQSDATMTKVNQSTYAAFSNKLGKGTPSQFWVQRMIDRTILSIYQTADSTAASKYLNIYFIKRIQDSGAYANATNVPYRFVPAMCSGLAFYLSQKYAPDRIHPLKLLYEDELARALIEDGSESSSYITPKTYYPNI